MLSFKLLNISALERMAQDYILKEDLTEEEVDGFIQLFKPREASTKYAVKDKVRHLGTVYEVIQAHTSQADWTPDKVPALFKVVGQTETSEGVEVIPDFEQPTSTTPYNKGDKVRFEGQIYQSKIDGNVWSPSGYPDGWEVIE